MTQQKQGKPDAFKAVMEAAKFELGRPELPYQSRGRELTAQEEALADALMELYASGVTGPDALAAALAQKGVERPSSGKADWTADSLAQELAALNADLDAAYAENGFGG